MDRYQHLSYRTDRGGQTDRGKQADRGRQTGADRQGQTKRQANKHCLTLRESS